MNKSIILSLTLEEVEEVLRSHVPEGYHAEGMTVEEDSLDVVFELVKTESEEL